MESKALEILFLSSMAGSILVLLILIVRWIFQHKIPSAFQYYIWLILLFKLLVPFGIESPISFSHTYEKIHIDATKKNPSLTMIEGDKTENPIKVSSISIQNPIMEKKTSALFIETEKTWSRRLWFLWAIGVGIQLARYGAGFKKLQRIVKSSEAEVKNCHRRILKSCIEEFRLKKEVELLYCREIASPSLCGIRKPKILIPEQIAVQVTEEEFRYIVLHELTHLKHKDLWLQWFVNGMSVLYWFNPILLYGFYKMRQDCEAYCDYKVINCLEKGENLQYGKAVIRLLQLGCAEDKGVYVPTLIRNRSEIKRRITMISKYEKGNKKRWGIGILLACVIGGAGVFVNFTTYNANKGIDYKVAEAVTKAEVAGDEKKESVQHGKSLSSACIPKDIVVYNSHPDEFYASGKNVTEIGAMFSDKLKGEGFNSQFVLCKQPAEYTKSYESSREAVTKAVKDYNSAILLDIHRNMKSEDNKDREKKKIVLTLATESPTYGENKKFAEGLMDKLKANKAVEVEMTFSKKGILYFNQDLSKHAVLIELGNEESSDEEVKQCMEALVSALKEIAEGK